MFQRLRNRLSKAATLAGALASLLAPAHASAALLGFASAVYDEVPDPDLLGTRGVAVSPDGNFVYATSARQDAISIFSRNSSTGLLTLVSVVRQESGGVDGLRGAAAIVISPDGLHLYVGGYEDDAIAVFSRNTMSGALTFVEVKRDGVSGVDGLAGINALAFSADGGHLYAAGSYDNAIATLARNSGTGALTFVSAITDSNLNGVTSLLVSPDGSHVYSAAPDNSAVQAFARSSMTGALSLVQTITVTGVGDIAVAISPDGQYVYSGRSNGNTIQGYSRHSTSGLLTPSSSILNSALNGLAALAMSPDAHGARLYAACDDSLVVLSRNHSTGALSTLETYVDDIAGVDGMYGASALALAADGRHVYVAAELDASIAIFGLASCGNGDTDFAEECDQGIVNGTTSSCCTVACVFKTTASVCRTSAGECDVAESCTGSSTTCPSDAFVTTGTSCSADGNVCTDDQCDGLGACAHPDNTASCDDGFYCNGVNTCSGGSCVSGSNPCPGADGDADCAESCDESTDTCTAADPNGSSCADGLFCNGNETCQSGSCTASGGDPCIGGGDCNDICNEAADNCLSPANTGCTDDGSTCTTDSCNGSGTCLHPVVVERHDCGNCEDGVDSDLPPDGSIDAEDVKCATLAELQRLAVLATAITGSRHIDSGGGVTCLPAGGGNEGVPYPTGASRCGLCAQGMKILTGSELGFLAVENAISFGQSRDITSPISIREEYVSDNANETYKSSPPLVGPGMCSNDAMQMCLDADDCGGDPETCDGRLPLDDPGNPYVDRSGTAENFLVCRNAIASALGIEQSVATVAGNVTGYLAADGASIVSNKATPLLTVTVGSGLQVLEVEKVQLQGLSTLNLAGTPTTTLVIRVKRAFKLGALAQVVLSGGLTADHVLWNAEGRGSVTMKQSATFAGTVLGPERKIKIGAGGTVEGALLGAKVKLLGNARVIHVPFTPWVE